MEIVRNDAKLKKMTRMVQFANLAALVILGLGFLTSLQGNISRVWLQWLALSIGIVVWQVSLNLGYRYTRRPRPDEVLDSSLKAAKAGSIIYHHVLPARHVLLTRSGPIVLHPIVNDGTMRVEGENGDIWRLKKPFFRRFLSQQPRLGNPTQETEQELSKLVGFIKEHAPELDEIPMGAVIVPVNPMAVLDVEASRIPVLKPSELKKFVRKQTGKPLPKEMYDTLKTIFDILD